MPGIPVVYVKLKATQKVLNVVQRNLGFCRLINGKFQKTRSLLAQELHVMSHAMMYLDACSALKNIKL